MKKMIAMICVLAMVLSLAACGGASADDGKYTIGICQIQTHDALDAATQGFKDALIAQLGEENLTFKEQDAGGEFTNCGTIMDGLSKAGTYLLGNYVAVIWVVVALIIGGIAWGLVEDWFKAWRAKRAAEKAQNN